MTRYLLPLALLLGLAACSSWMGEKEAAPLTGKREPVLQTVVADAKTAATEQKDAVPPVLPEATPNTVWGQNLGYPTHNPDHLSLPGSGAKRLWSASVGAGISHASPLMPNPVIVENQVFTIDTKGVATAFDLTSGKKLWHTATRAKKQSKDELSAGGGLAYGRGVLVATNGSSDVVALKADSGAVLWRTTLSAPLRGAAAVLGGRAYVSDAGNHVSALDTANGTKLWSYAGQQEETALLGTPAPAVDASRVIAALSSGQIVALGLEDGQPLWTQRFTSNAADDTLTTLHDIASVPVLDDGHLYAVNAAGRMMSIDVTQGARLWQKDVRGTGSLWTANSLVLLLTREGVSARDATDGSMRWEAPLLQYKDEDKEDPIHWYGPYLLSGRLYTFGSAGKAVVLDPATGKQIAMMNIDDDLATAPAVAQGMLAVISASGRLSVWK